MPRDRSVPPRPPDDPSEHPIAWFSALLRGVDRADTALVDNALTRLEDLGFFVVPIPSKTPRGQGGGR
jgi:hypothetical protein